MATVVPTTVVKHHDYECLQKQAGQILLPALPNPRNNVAVKDVRKEHSESERRYLPSKPTVFIIQSMVI